MKAEWTNNDSLATSQTTKAILVIDKPKSCEDCPCYHEGYGHCNNVKFRFIQDSDKVALWCPLKPIPEKRNCGKKTSEAGKIFEAWCWGWDACIDEITGETK